MSTFDEMALFLVILVPLLGAVLAMLLPSDRPKEAWRFAVYVAFLSLALSLFIFVRYDYGEGGFQFERTFEWLDAPLNIDFALGIDGISAPLILLNGIVLFGGVLISQNIRHRPRDFFVLLLALSAGVYGVFAVRDLFFLFFFYELAVLPMYLLIGVWGSSTDFGTFLRTKEYGAMKLFMYLVAGSVLVWIGILAVYVEAGEAGAPTFSLSTLGSLAEERMLSEEFQNWVFPLFMVGFGVLAGLWPFHTWSPDGHVAAPTAVSMLHAGVLMKLGAYGIVRVGMVLLPEGAENWMPVLISLGTVNVLYGAISAMSQTDLKYVIGYSSVSHMGYVLMGVATLDRIGVGGAVLQMFSHGIMTALMFLLVGAIYDRTHNRDIRVLNGLFGRMKVTSFFFAIAGLASLGLPGLSGFIAEFMVFTGAFRTYLPLAVLAVIGAALTAVYILRLLARTFFGEGDTQWAHLTDASPVEKAVGGAFVLILIFVGVWPEPLMRVINIGVNEILGA
ncbi:MAG: NADH-quinone oxidoreductase subunit M [Dehalococcoidia bacterium]|nr:NADH-quinone oxidoreductase subunit M [Dehalococcoidia bacterium]